MKLQAVRKYALALGEVTEEPHHEYTSFRVGGKIFATAPPSEQHLHVFPPEHEREHALAMYPAVAEKLFWGGKAVGVKLNLALAEPNLVKSLLRAAFEAKSKAGPRRPAGRRPAGTVAQAKPGGRHGGA